MKKQILLVEDNEATAEMTQKQLELLGYEVITARNGVEAVEKASSDMPDLIMMDILMPELDGLQAASQIKKDPKTQSIPILAATAKALSGDREKCLATGCDSYLAKPFTHWQLGAEIKRLLKDIR